MSAVPHDPEPEELTFEQAYEGLKRIGDRLDQDDVPIDEACSLFARGKGLEVVLRDYLTTQQGKLEAIERGENLPRFRIVAPVPGGAGGADQPHDSLFSPPAPRDDDLPL